MSYASAAIKRLSNEYRQLQKPQNRVSDYYVAPLEENIFEWHFTLRGPGGDNNDLPYKEGLYHGALLFSRSYPLEPPDIIFFTRSGRFSTHEKICSTISSYHKELWQPTYDVALTLTALRHFMAQEDEFGVGAFPKNMVSVETKLAWAKEAWLFTCATCGRSSKEVWESEMKMYPETSAEKEAMVPKLPPSAAAAAAAETVPAAECSGGDAKEEEGAAERQEAMEDTAAQATSSSIPAAPTTAVYAATPPPLSSPPSADASSSSGKAALDTGAAASSDAKDGRREVKNVTGAPLTGLADEHAREDPCFSRRLPSQPSLPPPPPGPAAPERENVEEEEEEEKEPSASTSPASIGNRRSFLAKYTTPPSPPMVGDDDDDDADHYGSMPYFSTAHPWHDAFEGDYYAEEYLLDDEEDGIPRRCYLTSLPPLNDEEARQLEMADTSSGSPGVRFEPVLRAALRREARELAVAAAAAAASGRPAAPPEPMPPHRGRLALDSAQPVDREPGVGESNAEVIAEAGPQTPPHPPPPAENAVFVFHRYRISIPLRYLDRAIIWSFSLILLILLRRAVWALLPAF
jgi:ubiquitin-protein ligase